MLVDAGPRARAETESVTGLTSDFVVTALANLQDAPDPPRDLAALVANLQNLRHMRVALVWDGDPAVVSAFIAATDAKAPAWFRAIVHAPMGVFTIPVVVRQRRLGSILIVADPSDEIDEVWSAAQVQAAASGVLALAVLFASSLFIRWALKPLGLAGTALARLQAGDYSARVEPSGSPEFVEICRGSTVLRKPCRALARPTGTDRTASGCAGRRAQGDRPRIARRDRAAFVRLASQGGGARSRLGRSRRRGGRGDLDPRSGGGFAGAQPTHSGAPQAGGAGGIGPDRGAESAGGAMAKGRARRRAGVFGRSGVTELGERASLMAYRFVQEALTNAFRHSHAHRIEVTLAYDEASATGSVRDPALSGLCIRIPTTGEDWRPM